MENSVPFDFNFDQSRRFRAVRTYSTVRWAYASTFLVAWQDAQTKQECVIGDIPTSNQERTASYFLAFGCSDINDKLIFTIHLPLKFTSRSKGACNIYLVITPACFDISTGPASAYSHALNSAAALQFQRAGVQPETDFLHYRLVLKEPSQVIMSIPEAQRLPSKHSRGLLLKLKSLSEVTTFDIHLPRTPQSQETTAYFFQRLYSGATVAPEIDYKATFSGQEWKINNWTAYGINEDNPLVANSNTAIQAHLPPYKEAVQGPRRDSEAASTTHKEAPIYSSIRPPRPPLCSETSESIPDTESIHSLKLGGDDATYTLLGAEEPMEPQDTGEQSFLLEKTGTLPQEHEADSQEVDSGSSVVQRTHGKRKADEAFSSTATIDGRSTALKEPEGVDLRQIIPIFNPAAARVSPKEFQTCAVEIAWRHLIIFGRSIFDDEGPNHRFFTRVQYRWFCDAILWFKKTWEREHDASEFYLTELSALCSAIIMQNRPGFDQFRTICMSKSIQRVVVTMDQGPWGIRLVPRSSRMAECWW